MSVDRRTVLWFLVSTLIFAALVYVSDVGEFLATISSSDPGYVALAVLSGCFTLLMWSVVWHRFFGLFDVDVTFRDSVQLLLAGTFLNSVTPLGRFGGEPFVALLVSRRSEATAEQALSSVSSADLSNSLPFLTLGGASVAYLAAFGTLESVVADVAILLVLLLFAAGLAIYLLWFGGTRHVADAVDSPVSLDSGFGRWQRYVDAARAKLRELLAELRAVGRNPRNAAGTLLVSHLAVAGHVGATYFVLLAVDVEPVLPSIVLVVTLSALLTFSPTPGSTGTFEAGFAALVTVFFPVGVATATSVAVLYRVGTYLPGVVLGYGSLVGLRAAGDDGD